MKKTVFFSLALLAISIGAIQNGNAGSAVALAPNNQMVASFGHPVEIAKSRALAQAYSKYGSDVRILAATDETGYGAVAVGRRSNATGWVLSVVLGKRSATEANTLAIEQCIKAGGTNPYIKYAFRG
jgi:hypothetical protein